MGANGADRGDFYQVLGLNKACSESDIKNAYKKLALKWHPDRCLASGNVEEAKNRFQAIQEAYSVLSNANKRFLYDVGIYDSDDDENGMADFLSEMAVMMTQNKPAENAEESFEELKDLFQEMFQSDMESSSQTGSSTSHSSLFSSNSNSNKRASSEMSSQTGSSTSHSSLFSSSSNSNKRASSEMSNTKAESTFCFGTGGWAEDRSRGRRRRKGWT